MSHPRRKLPFLPILIVSLTVSSLSAQTSKSGPARQPGDRSAAYYHFAMGHLYAELAGMYSNRAQYFAKAIDNYRMAIKEDPEASFLVDELADLYIQSGKLRDGVADAEAMLKESPDNLNARRILGRIYTRLIGDARQDKVQEEMLHRALEQYQKITEKDPKDVDSWLRQGWLQRVSHSSNEAVKSYKTVLAMDANNEEALTGLAAVYSDVGDYKSSIDVLKKVADKNPSVGVLTALAGSYEQTHDYGKATEALRRAADLAPNNPEIKRALAQDLLYSGDTAESQKIYADLAQGDPKNAQVQLRLSQIYRQQHKFDQARQALEKAKELDPDNLEVRYNEVNLLEAEGKQSEAVALLKSILESTAKSSYTPADKSNRTIFLERLAILYRETDKYTEAVAAFQEMADLDPSVGPRASAQIVETYRAAKDFPKALEAANAAYKKYPNDRTVRVVRASVLADAGKGEEAIADLRKMLDGKNDRETYLQLAQIYDKTKNYPEMEKALDSAEKLSDSKDDAEAVYFMRGAMYEKLKKYEEAEKAFHKVLENNPENASALNYLGYMLADRNTRLPEARTYIAKALEIDPDNGAYLDSLGWVYYRMDKLTEAESYLRRALEKYSHDPVVNEHLGDVYFQQGKLKEAISQWQASLKEFESGASSDNDPEEIAKIQRKLENAKVRLAKESNAPPRQ